MSVSIHDLPPRQQALHFIAAYERDNAAPDEEHLVDIARRWLTLINNSHYAEGVVTDILADFDQVDAAQYPSAWGEMRNCFTNWAKREDYL